MDQIKELLGTSLGNISLGSVCSAIITFVICYCIGKIILKLVNRVIDRADNKLDAYFKKLIKNVLKIVIYVIIALIVAGALGIDTTSLIAAFSVLGLAVSLAVQNTLTNVAGGLMILFTKPFVLGDYIETSGMSGTAIEIGLSYTKLQTPDNKIVCIPNGDLANTRITDYSTKDTRRVDFNFTASYDAPTELVKQALYEAMSADSRILPEPAPFVGLNAFNANDIEYVARAWCSSEDYWNVYFDMNERVREIFADKGIEFSFPHIIVHTEDK